jgi:hypothetical protein
MATAPGLEYANWNSLPGGGGGLGNVAAAYLAHKAGLIDLNNKSQTDSIQKNGIFEHMAMNAVKDAIKPPPVANAPVAPVAPAAPVEVGAPMTQELPQGVPLEPLSAIEVPDIAAAALDTELIDSSLLNFAALLV